LAALVTTEPDRGRRTVLPKGDKCDLHRLVPPLPMRVLSCTMLTDPLMVENPG
jgi:hypothetical protein